MVLPSFAGFFESFRAELEAEAVRTKIKPVQICMICPPTIRTALRSNSVKPDDRLLPQSFNNKAIDVRVCTLFSVQSVFSVNKLFRGCYVC
jgi:hypothetical protein